MDHSYDEAACDQLAVLAQQEQRFYRCPDYLSEEHSPRSNLFHLVEEFANVVTDHATPPSNSTKDVLPTTISARVVTKSPSATSVRGVHEFDKEMSTSTDYSCFAYWRQQMFDWSSKVVDSYGMSRDVIASSFNLLDRFVAAEKASSSEPITRDDFQLFSMTCLYIAVKMNEPYPKKISLQALVHMSRGFYSEKDIEITERDILRTLKWHVNPPVAIDFSRLIWNNLLTEKPSARMIKVCESLTEIAVAEGSFVPFKQAHIGLAAVILAARLEGMHESPIRDLLTAVKDILQLEGVEFTKVYYSLEELYSR